MGIEKVPDKDLLYDVSCSDRKAFKILFNRYRERFYAAALKMTHSNNEAEEIVQQVFVALWQGRSNLKNIDQPESYLFSIVYNTISCRFRKIAAEKKLKAGLKGKKQKAENYTEQTVLAKESRQWLQNIINHLPSQQQKIYRLSKEDGLSRKEIAERLELSPHTVKNHLLKAMQFIRGHWGEVTVIVWMLIFF